MRKRDDEFYFTMAPHREIDCADLHVVHGELGEHMINVEHDDGCILLGGMTKGRGWQCWVMELTPQDVRSVVDALMTVLPRAENYRNKDTDGFD